MRRVLVLLLVAMFSLGHGCTEEDPAAEYYADKNLTTEAVSDAGRQLTYIADPSPIPMAEEFGLTVTVHDESGSPLQVDALEFRGDMPAHGHGMNVEPLVEDLGDGVWSVDPLLFHMPGHWEMEVAIQVDGAWDSAIFDVRCCE